MVKRYNFSVPEEEHKRMKTLALEMGMSVSDIIRKCFFKLSVDEKMRAIIKRGEFTSHNVRYDGEKKADAADGNGPDSSSLNPSKEYHKPTPEEQAFLDHCVQVAKVQWIEDYE